MRAFIAVELDADVREALDRLQGRLRETCPLPVTWVRPQAMHVTLRFLGDITPVQARAIQISGTIGNHTRKLGKDWGVNLAGSDHALAVTEGTGNTRVAFEAGNELVIATDWQPGQTLATVDIGGETLAVKVDLKGPAIRLRWRGMDVTARVRSPRVAALAKLMPEKLPPDTSKMLLCPMPGLVVSLAVREGQEVKAGETLAVVEAMKMENVLRAERDLTVSKINAKQGDSLAVDAVIMEFA